MKKRKIKCPYCGQQAKLVQGDQLWPSRPDLKYRRFWRCALCDAHVGVHRNSYDAPMGKMANEKLRKARKSVHRRFDLLWINRDMNRDQAYRWLARRMGIKSRGCHIGFFSLNECRKAIEMLDVYIERRNYNFTNNKPTAIFEKKENLECRL